MNEISHIVGTEARRSVRVEAERAWYEHLGAVLPFIAIGAVAFGAAQLDAQFTAWATHTLSFGSLPH